MIYLCFSMQDCYMPVISIGSSCILIRTVFFILYVSMFLSSISVDTEVVQTHETRKCYTKKPKRPCKWVYNIVLLLYTSFGVQYASFFNQLTFVSECCCKDITCKPCLVRSS